MNLNLKRTNSIHPRELSKLRRILTSEGIYLEKLNLELTEEVAGSHVISETSIFNFMKVINRMRHTLVHLSLDFSKLVIENAAGYIANAIKDIDKLQYLKLGINLRNQEFTPSHYIALEKAIASKSKTMSFFST